MSRSQVGQVLADRRRNAYVGWLLVGFLAAVAAGNLFGGLLGSGGDLVWAAFVAGVLALSLVPPVAYRDWTVMLPWEVLVIAALPIIGRTLATVTLTGNLAMYLSVAAMALIVAVELHAFTSVRMTHGFAVFFVVVVTMATSGIWAVTRWAIEMTLGIPALYPNLDAAATHEAVNWEFVYSTVAGLAAGGIFDLYFRRWARLADRVPEEVGELV